MRQEGQNSRMRCDDGDKGKKGREKERERGKERQRQRFEVAMLLIEDRGRDHELRNTGGL